MATDLPPVPPPPPEPSSAAVRRIMQGNRGTNTTPERHLRSVLHGRGLRFRKNLRLDIDGVAIRPDIVFAGSRVAVFVDGCFWHRCPEHGNDPKTNSWYWGPKLDRNVARDRRADATLADAGWRVLRAWGHEDIQTVAERIVVLVGETRPDRRRARSSSYANSKEPSVG